MNDGLEEFYNWVDEREKEILAEEGGIWGHLEQVLEEYEETRL